MNQIAVAPELLAGFHELAQVTHRSDAELINEALASYLSADHRYVSVLAERIDAANRGEFASDEAVDLFFASHAENVLVVKPDAELSAAWAAEAEDRWVAYRRGELVACDEAEVFGNLDPS